MEYNYFIYNGCIFRVPKDFNGRFYNFLEILSWENTRAFNFRINAYSRECAEEINFTKCEFKDFNQLFLEFYSPILGEEKAKTILEDHFLELSTDLKTIYSQIHSLEISKFAKAISLEHAFVENGKKVKNKTKKNNYEYLVNSENAISDTSFDNPLLRKI
ncbi:MAG: hypothetical protein MJ227_02425 [Bacilli bacterium]|nr:hypothetical protein [Bacilli bacterium]